MATKPPSGKPPGIYVYCTPKEKDLLRRAAKAARQTLSAYMMTCALERAKKEGHVLR